MKLISHLSSAGAIHAWSFASVPSIYLYDVEHSYLCKTFPPDNPLYYTVLILSNVFSIPALRKMCVSITEGSIFSCYSIIYSTHFLLLLLLLGWFPMPVDSTFSFSRNINNSSPFQITSGTSLIPCNQNVLVPLSCSPVSVQMFNKSEVLVYVLLFFTHICIFT